MSNVRVLVVDDEPHIVDMLKLRLEAGNFDVTAATSGTEALEKLGMGFDVVMADIMMPEMDGIELLRKIKEGAPDTEVIIMTGFASLDTAIEAVRLGAFDYIRKPFEDVKELMRAIGRAAEKKILVVKNRSLMKEITESNEQLKKINLMLGDNVNELVMLHHIVESISGTISIGQIEDRFLKQLVDSMEFRTALLFLVNESQNIIELKASAGIDAGVFGSVVFSLDDKSHDIVRVLDKPEAVFLRGFDKNLKDKLLSKVVDKDTQNVIYYPLRVRENLIGALVLVSNKELILSRMHTLSLYIHQVSLTMLNARIFAKLVKINEELEEMDKLKTEFISTVSHELRTPLTTIKEGVSIILEGVIGEINERQEHVLEMARGDVDRLARLIEDLLNISRIESGKVVLGRARVSVKVLIGKSLSSAGGALDAKGIRVGMSIEEGLPDVYVDEDKIMQVLVNLISNAVKFSPEGSSITVAAKTLKEEGSGFVEVDIRDQGVGISNEDRDRLFQKFSQINRENGPGYKGTGLGLAISKELVALHEGKIWLKESDPDKGAVFSFTIPVYEPGIEGKTELGDSIAAEIKKSRRVKGDFGLLSIKGIANLSDDEKTALIKKMEEELPSKEGKVGLYSKNMLLILIKNAGKSSIVVWKDNVVSRAGAYIRKDMEIRIVSYPEDGETKEELLKKI